MKQTVRYQMLSIPSKLRMEVRITVDDRNTPEYQSMFEGNKNTGISFLPIISLIIVRPSEMDENGNRVKAKWVPNDTLGMTKYNVGIFANELSGMMNDMKTPELYSYHGKRLELNEAIAEKIRRPFVVGTMTVELSAVVITQPDDSRVEGIKMKFNNESSSVLLTLNELTGLEYNIRNLNVDALCLLMYMNYISKPNGPTTFDSSSLNVDIKPKEFIE